MDRCPAEILQQIFQKLASTPADVAALRLAGKLYAVIGTKYLVNKVRFHTSDASFERLKRFTEHTIFKDDIKSLVFEGTVLAFLPCQHIFASHWELPHHENERPTVPPPECSDRERRLYARNLAKFDSELDRRYHRYRAMYQEQQSLIASGQYNDVLGSAIRSFPKLEEVTLTNVGRCKHHLSKRFMDKYTVDCAVPLDPDSCNTVRQLRSLLSIDTEEPAKGLKVLNANVLSPLFFLQANVQPKIQEAFRSLQKISLTFQMDTGDREMLEAGEEIVYDRFSKGGLRNALAAAADLEELSINFNEAGYLGPCAHLSFITGYSTWPKLRKLDVDDVFIDDPESLVSTLKRQPALKRLSITASVLLEGTWVDATRRMRQELGLSEFHAYGFLEDDEDTWVTHHIHADMFRDSGEKFCLGAELAMYVTDKDYMFCVRDGEEPPHPLEISEWRDPDELKEELQMEGEASFGDSDASSHGDCD